MNLKINDTDFDLIRSYIEESCGISIGTDKKYLVETRLTKLVVENGSVSFGDFYRKVNTSKDPQLRDRIIDAITTNETLWFRDSAPWLALRDLLLPRLANDVSSGKKAKVRIWSAACSTGQEPYTVSMVVDLDVSRSLAGNALGGVEKVEILGTDISPSALFIAMAGRYDKISMRRGLEGEWAPFKTKYFNDAGRVSVISEEVKKRVKFQRFNLMNSFSSFRKFDVIFLRNVAIYFSEDFKRILFNKLADSLNPDGCLILGSAESLTSYSNRFSAEEFGRAVVYRRKK